MLARSANRRIEDDHLFDVYLGESIAPYVDIGPLKALLPMKKGEPVPADPEGVGGIGLGGLGEKMRLRWQTIDRLWESNKKSTSTLNLLERLDYHGALSAQVAWQDSSATDHAQATLLTAAGGRDSATRPRRNSGRVYEFGEARSGSRAEQRRHRRKQSVLDRLHGR